MVTEHNVWKSTDDNIIITNPVAEQSTQTVEDPLSERIESIQRTQIIILHRLQTLENTYEHIQAHTCTCSNAQVPAPSDSLPHPQPHPVVPNSDTDDWLSLYTNDPFEMLDLTPSILSPHILSPTPPPLPSPLPPLPPPYPSSNQPLPCSLKSKAKYALSLSDIDKTGLKSVQDILKQNSDLRTESGCGTLAQRLAKETVFGVEIMKRCTPAGSKKLPGLPQEGLYEIKKIIFSELYKFHNQPGDFEPIWQRKCMVAIEQACNRLRKYAV